MEGKLTLMIILEIGKIPFQELLKQLFKYVAVVIAHFHEIQFFVRQDEMLLPGDRQSVCNCSMNSNKLIAVKQAQLKESEAQQEIAKKKTCVFYKTKKR